MVFITNNKSAKALKPRKQMFDFPLPFVSTQCSAALGGRLTPVVFTRRDRQNASFLCQAFIQKVPSIKPSTRLMPPRSFKSWGNAVSILTKTPHFAHSGKRRWQVLFGKYRCGKSV
jgi:hypothetical protein